jgi:hypothetical protein
VSIFTKPISSLTFDDLQELLNRRAVESVRLEFKRDVPNRDETLKKLSSFANTLGGLMVVGAEAGNDGRITALAGVLPQPSYKQTLIQWCFDGVSPPIDLEVSDPIPTRDGTGSACYVVSVRESPVAPHFLNGRKGAWLRTDEFSSRVKSELATDAELQQLLRRRQLVVERRKSLVARSRERFATFTNHKYAEFGRRAGGIGARFELSVGPTFPMSRVCGEAHLLKTIQSSTIPWRQVGFPRTTAGGVISQHESAIVLRPGSSFSILEANVWGMLFYASEIELHDPPRYEGIHVYHFAGQLEIFLRHAAKILQTIGYSGPLGVELTLKGIRDVPWVYAGEFNDARTGPTSILDDEASSSLDTSTHELNAAPDRLMADLMRFVFFSVGWQDVAVDENELHEMVKMGYYYNYSKKPAALKL